LAEASVKDMITKDQLHSALMRTDKLLNTMYQKTFDQYTKLIDRYDI